MPLYASGVKIDPTLSGTLSGIGNPAYNAIGEGYGKAKKQFGTDASARGMNGARAAGPGSYAGGQFAAKQGLDIGNLESALGGGISNTAYQDTLGQRDFNQQAELAREVAALNKPSDLEQVLSGIGKVGGVAAKYYGAKNNKGKDSGGGFDANGPLSLYGKGPTTLAWSPGMEQYAKYAYPGDF